MATEEEKLIPQRATNDVGVKRDPDLGDSDHKPKLRASDGDDTAYFSYYSQLQHQASMMQDAVRSGVYQRAILGHSGTHFAGKLVMDVGAGNGILSIFAIQAGAARVYAIEASDMVEHLRTLAKAATGGLATKTINDDEQWYLQAQGFDARAQNTTTSNPWLAQKLVPVASKVEAVTAKHLDGNEKVDTIVSECLGVLLVHERMCESFIDARDRFLKPGGAMFPSAGSICFAPIEDSAIWEEVATKARFWNNASYYGCDLRPFFASAWREAFSSPVVGCFNPQTLVSSSLEHPIDFTSITMENLRQFELPLDWSIRTTALVHGIGGWFDLYFQPPLAQKIPAGSEVDSDATEDDDIVVNRPPVSQSADATMSDLGTESAYGGLSVDAPAFRPAASTPGAGPGDLGASAAITQVASAAAFEAAAGLAAENSSFMSTSPYATPTHWQQARLLFPEPLAANRGQRLVGRMKFVVNEQRSYDITAEVRLIGAHEDGTPYTAAFSKDNRQIDHSTTRRFAWKLDRQTYSFTTSQ